MLLPTCPSACMLTYLPTYLVAIVRQLGIKWLLFVDPRSFKSSLQPEIRIRLRRETNFENVKVVFYVTNFSLFLFLSFFHSFLLSFFLHSLALFTLYYFVLVSISLGNLFLSQFVTLSLFAFFSLISVSLSLFCVLILFLPLFYIPSQTLSLSCSLLLFPFRLCESFHFNLSLSFLSFYI